MLYVIIIGLDIDYIYIYGFVGVTHELDRFNGASSPFL